MDNARKALLLVIAVLGACALAVQFYLAMTRHPEHTALWRMTDFFSYFTNTTGIIVTAVATLALVRPSAPLAQPGAVAAGAVYIFVVCITYELLLRSEAHGLYFFTNTSLHEVMPVLVVLLWLAFTPKRALGWREPLAWLVYPAIYIAWILARGAVVHRYPYFFADVDKLGYPHALLNGAGFLAAFYGLGLGAVGLGRLTRKNAPDGAEPSFSR